MTNVSAVIGADLHLDELIWRDKEFIHSDAYWGMQQLIDLAVSHNADFIGLGDLTESLLTVPTTKTLSFIREQVARVYAAGNRVYTLAGNHDPENPGYFYACGAKHDNLDLTTVEIGGLSCFFMGFRPDHMLEAAMNLVPQDTDIVFAHQQWKELKGGSRVTAAVAAFKAGHTLITGDLHENMDIIVTRRDGKQMRAISPGATHMRKINEPTAHYALLLYDDGSLSRVKLRSRVVYKVRIETESDFESLCNQLPTLVNEAVDRSNSRQLPAAIRTPLIIVWDSCWITGAEARINNIIGENAHCIYYMVAKQDQPTTNYNVVLSAEESIESLLPDMLRLELPDDEAARDLVYSAITSDNIKKSVLDFRDSMLKT